MQYETAREISFGYIDMKNAKRCQDRNTLLDITAPILLRSLHVHFEMDPLRKSLLAPVTLEGLHFVVDGRHVLVQISSAAKSFVAITTNT